MMGYIKSSQGGDEDGSERFPIHFCYSLLSLGPEAVQPALPQKLHLDSQQGLLGCGGDGDADDADDDGGGGDDVDGGGDEQVLQVEFVWECLCVSSWLGLLEVSHFARPGDGDDCISLDVLRLHTPENTH